MKHLIFDLDGTLIDSYPGLKYSIVSTIEKVYPEKKLAPDLQVPIGPRIQELMRLILGDISQLELNRLETEFRLIYDSYGWKSFSIYPDVIDTLRILCFERKVLLYVVTNKPKLPTAQILNAMNVAPFFTEVVCPDSRQPRFVDKADSLVYLLKKYRFEGNELVYVGDTLEDWQASQQAQIPFLGAKYGYGKLSTESGFPTIKSFQDLLFA